MWYLILLALVGELIDSSLGMMYGTLLSPLLIGMGHDPLKVIPAILFSQGIGGLVGTVGHHRLANGDFGWLTRDTKIALAIVVPGVIACFIGVFCAISIPSDYLKCYIGILVIIMGVLCIFPIAYKFNWKVIGFLGFLSGFNKALSGGGFGPVTSTGKILGGVTPKVSVATTTFAEVPICLVSFLLYCLFGGNVDWVFTGYLSGGAVIGAVFGVHITKRVSQKYLRIIVGLLAVLCGAWIIIKLFGG